MGSPLPGVYQLTYADWLGFPDDGRYHEIIDGELFVTPPPAINHYEASGVSEYWIVDPESKTVEVLALSRGQYERHGLFRGNSVLSSRLLPGLSFPVADIFPDGA
ncbi:MAG TPA: Uma2 family endonuclease [Kofleriaceae bacterium]|nr:Uma2 family endonuclease [Kofleriaceae bacterium]